MSSGIATPPLNPREAPVAPPTECEVVIHDRLQATQRHVKGVDIASGLIAMAIGVLAYLLATAAIDHWLIVGGLGFWGRLWLWMTLVVVGGTYFVGRVLPPLVRRINPVFAAATIERSQPSLKNSLVNFLLLRGHRTEVAPPVYQAMEYRAASDLARVQIDVAVDRAHIVRLLCVLAGVLTVFCLYFVVSPKNPIRSAARVLWPWSSLEAPTRVTIRDIKPGDTTAFHGDVVTISAEIAGLREGESALLVYSTANGETVDQTIPMTKPEGEYRYQCRLPPGNLGVQQDYRYSLAGGDYRSRVYGVEVQTAPAIEVEKVTYHYPAYTGIADQTAARQGDLRAIEGTEVTIQAAANTELKPGTAEIDLGCTGNHGLRMSVDGRTALGQFTLRLNAKDPSRPEYDAYQLRFSDSQGRENQRPIRHRIDVIRDLPPEVQLVEPQQPEVQVPADGKLDIKVQAEDPDFGLRHVTLEAQRNGRSLPRITLLDKKKPEQAWPGQFSVVYTFQPARLGLKAGDRVEYWAEAEDNKEPTPGVAASAKQWIVVTGAERKRPSNPASEGAASDNTQHDKATPTEEKTGKQPGDPTNVNQPPADQSPENLTTPPTPDEKKNPKQSPPDKKKQTSPDQPTDGQQGDSSKKGESGSQKNGGESGQGKGKEKGDQQSSGEQKGDQTGNTNNERIDPETDPGGAMKEILKDRDQNKEQPKTNQSKSPNQPQPGEQSQNEAGKNQAGNQGGNNGSDKSQNQQGKSGQGGNDKSATKNAGGQAADGQNKGADNAKPDQNAKGGQPGKDKAGANNSDGQGADGKNRDGDKAKPDQKGKGGESDADTSATKNADGQNADGKNKDSDNSAAKKTNVDKKTRGQADAEKSPTEQPNGEQGASQPPPKEDQNGKNAQGAPEEKPGLDTKGGQPQGSEAGSPEQKKQGDEQTAEQKKSGGKQSDQQQPGAGQNADNNAGSPEPQGENKSQEKKPDQAGAAPGEKKSEMPQSPSTSRNQSDSKGDTAGNHSGGGEQGGGQQANQRGIGGAGSHTAADEGDSHANEPGKGEIGKQSGNQAAAKQPTGSSEKAAGGGGTDNKSAASGRSGEGPKKSSENQPSEKANEKSADRNNPAEPERQNAANGGTPGKGTSAGPGTQASGIPGGGGQSNAGAATPPEAAEQQADQANIDYARRQVGLALEHLRDQAAAEKPELLDRLGWTKDDARRFLERWEQMREAAAQKGPEGDAARKHLNEALKSLGLRPHGTELRPGGVSGEQRQPLRDPGRFAPPPEWIEQFREYTRGVAGAQQHDGRP